MHEASDRLTGTFACEIKNISAILVNVIVHQITSTPVFAHSHESGMICEQRNGRVQLLLFVHCANFFEYKNNY